MFKIVGILCVLVGCIGYGLNRIGEERSRIGHLGETIRIIKRIQDEISYGKHTLPEICLILSECCAPPFQQCFSQIYEQINAKSGVPINSIWEQQMEQCMRNTLLTDEEKDILRKLPRGLGMQDEKLQAESIGRSVELLVRNRSKLEDAYENKAKMIFSVSILMGVFLTIMLL